MVTKRKKHSKNRLLLAMDIAKVFHVSVEELFEFVDNE